ncbi:MAG: copper amine oxidase N-terminal domain-containing protein [Mycobacterium leprae]
MEQRGRPFGIQQSLDFHVKYNQSTMRVYLLDRYIQRVTDGKKDLTDFTRAMWNVVKDRKAPAEFTEADGLAAFASVVGTANQEYIRQLADQKEFVAADFAPLLPQFRKYVHWMADQFFGGNDLLFLAYLDIAAAKGNEWPHYATFPHQVPFKLPEAMTPFWQYLQGRSGTLTQADVLAALSAATGRDHSGFFEFWAAQGFALDPASLTSVGAWNPAAPSEGDRLPQSYETVGSLQMEHQLAGIPQQAVAVLDSPAATSTITVTVSVTNPGGHPSLAEAEGALTGNNVQFQDSYTFTPRFDEVARARFEVTTTDPERRRFPFILTMPRGTSYPHFSVPAPAGKGIDGYGILYFIPAITPVDFSPALDAVNRKLTLPAVSLKGAQFVLTDGSSTVKAAPGETVQLTGDAPRIDLLDSYGFLRGRQSLSVAQPAQPPVQPPVQPPTQPPTQPVKTPAELSQSGEIRVMVDGQIIPFDVSPANVNGRILVPLRAIAEALGAKVEWDPAAQVIALTKNGHVVRLSIGGEQAALDDQYFTLDVPPQIIGDRTMVPVRFISQALGATVNWDPGSRTVIITSP